MASGGAGGGLARGIMNGFQMHQQAGLMDLYKQDRERQAKNDERDNELHQMKMDDFKRSRVANEEVAGLLSGGNQFAQKPKTEALSDTRAPGLNMVASTASAPSDAGGPGLATISKPEAPQMPAGTVIAKHALTGNLLDDPDKMTAVAEIYAKHGMLEKMLPWMNQAHQAKKSGFIDALPHLLGENGAGAAEALRRAGIPVEGDLTLIDPKTQTWEGMVGGNKRQIDAKRVAGMANPETWLKMQQDQQKLAAEQPEREAKIDALKANSEKDRSMAKAYAAGSLGAGRRSAGGAGPKVQRTVETDQGLVAIMSDGTKRIIADDRGMPMFGTSAQKIAAGLVGKTIDPLSETADIAGRVNDMTGQLRGGKPPPPARLSDLPEGAKHIGTSGGKPVYEVNGRRFISE